MTDLPWLKIKKAQTKDSETAFHLFILSQLNLIWFCQFWNKKTHIINLHQVQWYTVVKSFKIFHLQKIQFIKMIISCCQMSVYFIIMFPAYWNRTVKDASAQGSRVTFKHLSSIITSLQLYWKFLFNFCDVMLMELKFFEIFLNEFNIRIFCIWHW